MKSIWKNNGWKLHKIIQVNDMQDKPKELHTKSFEWHYNY
jgi:hypothetical protein